MRLSESPRERCPFGSLRLTSRKRGKYVSNLRPIGIARQHNCVFPVVCRRGRWSLFVVSPVEFFPWERSRKILVVIIVLKLGLLDVPVNKGARVGDSTQGV